MGTSDAGAGTGRGHIAGDRGGRRTHNTFEVGDRLSHLQGALGSSSTLPLSALAVALLLTGAAQSPGALLITSQGLFLLGSPGFVHHGSGCPRDSELPASRSHACSTPMSPLLCTAGISGLSYSGPRGLLWRVK